MSEQRDRIPELNGAYVEQNLSLQLASTGENLPLHVFGYSEGKDPDQSKNEDFLAFNGQGNFVVADGSTPKKGNARSVDGVSGGRLAADIVSRHVLNSSSNGVPLVDELTQALRGYYGQYNSEALDDPRASFATTFVAARVVETANGGSLWVTQVGDTAFRINGGRIFREERQIDVIDAATRSRVMEAEIAKGTPLEQAAKRGRVAIEPSLNAQFRLWNNPTAPLGFGYLNGHNVPDKFVHTYEFPLHEIHTLEIFSDGYPKIAGEPTIRSWEAAYVQVESEDPQRYLTYLSTKSKDDRSVLVVHFNESA